jgi:hypothetical protein
MQRPANGGVTVSKSYQMLCGSCSKRFTSKFARLLICVEVMIVDMSESPEDKNLSLYDIQGYFNSVLSKFINKILNAKCRSRICVSILFVYCADHIEYKSPDW